MLEVKWQDLENPITIKWFEGPAWIIRKIVSNNILVVSQISMVLVKH